MITQPLQPGTVNEKSPPRSLLQDPVLRSAYERLHQYDRAALRYKSQHVNLRAMVFLLAFIASLLAVVVSAGGQFFWVALWIQQVFQLNLNTSGLDQTIGLVLFLIPLIGSGLLAYATQPLPNASWVNYRFSAEMIRRAIYCYIMQAGDFYDKPLTARQMLLVKAMQSADGYSNENVDVVEPFLNFNDVQLSKQIYATLFIKNSPCKRTIQDQLSHVPGKIVNGTLFVLRKRTWLQPLVGINAEETPAALRDPTFDDYYVNRFLVQLEWYTFKAATDFDEARRLQRRGLIIGGAGSLLSFLGFAPWIAVTTAAATTTSGLAGLLMYGRTYTAYLVAAQRLRADRDTWAIKTPTQQADAGERAMFIAQCEGCFREEMETWSQIAAQNLSEVDRTLRDRLDQQRGSVGAVVTVESETTVKNTDTIEVQASIEGDSGITDKLADAVSEQMQTLTETTDDASSTPESRADDIQSVALDSGSIQSEEDDKGQAEAVSSENAVPAAQ